MIVALDFDGTFVEKNIQRIISTTFSTADKAHSISDSISMLEKGETAGEEWMGNLLKDVKLVDKENLLKFLNKCKEKNADVYIVTANKYPEAIRYFLKSHGISEFIPDENVMSLPALKIEGKELVISNLIEKHKANSLIFIDDSTNETDKIARKDFGISTYVSLVNNTGLSKLALLTATEHLESQNTEIKTTYNQITKDGIETLAIPKAANSLEVLDSQKTMLGLTQPSLTLNAPPSRQNRLSKNKNPSLKLKIDTAKNPKIK